MNAPAKLAALVFSPLAFVGVLFALKSPAPMPTSDPILEIHDASLTNYLKDAATPVQGVRPRVQQRGLNLDGSLRAVPFPAMAIAGNPFGAPVSPAGVGGVRLSTGALVVTDVDLSFPAPGAGSWSAARTYNARQDDSGSHFDSNGPMGRNWAASLPEILLYEHESDNEQDVLYLVYGADRFAEFRRTGDESNAFKGTNGAAGIFVYAAGASSEPDTYTLTDTAGNEITFFGFDGDSSGATGQFWKIEDDDTNGVFVGHRTTDSLAISGGYDANGRILNVIDGASRRWTYTYTTLASVKRLTSIVVETKTGGTWASPTGVAEVGRAEYEYYVDADSYGDNGDLKLVEITTPLTDSGVTSVRKKLYRYWESSFDPSTNPGHVHALKYIVDFEGTRRFDWTDTTFDEDFLSASNGSLEPYASAYFEYDSSHRVDLAWFSGDCGCSGSGNGTHAFEYETNGSYADNAGYDTAWMGRTIVERPDGSYLTSYHDEAHQQLSHVVTDLDPDNTDPAPSKWVTRVVRDADGLVSDIHSPANCTGYTHSTGAITSSTNAGLVTSFVRTNGANAYWGFIQDRTWKKGTSDSAKMSETFEYTTEELTVGGVALAQVWISARHDYPAETTTTQGSGSQENGISRTYHTSTLRRKGETRTHPVVSTAKNGSNSATSEKDYREIDGRLTWSKDENDVLRYTEYTNGQVTKVILDADTTKNSVGQDFYGITPPTGYTTSGGIHRKTVYTYDAQGRLVTSTEDSGHVTKRYYTKLADGRLVTLTYPGFTPGSPDTYYGPVAVEIRNHGGETELSGTVALSGNSSTTSLTGHVDETDADPITAIEVGSLVRMTTSLYSESGGKLEESRQYFLIPGSGAGADGTNYDPTVYGYDDSGRRWRVKEPCGTIRRTVFDIHGRVTSSWIGTNDNSFASGEASGPDNMVKTEALEYDGGADDGNHYTTKRTLYVEDSTTDQRVTNSQNDLFGRALVEENPVAPHAFHKYDNEGRNVATGMFSSIGSIVAGTDDPTSETANRLELFETAFDEMGRAWKTIRHKIDVSDGSSDDTLEALTWRDAVGRVTKTDGESLTKTLYDDLARHTHRFVLASDNDSVYADADDVSGDIVLEEEQTTYEVDSSEVIMEAKINRLYNDISTGETTGALDTNADADSLLYTAANLEGRIQITAHWYDAFGRVVDTVLYGTNGGSNFDRDGLSVPARSDTALRTTFTYNDSGELEQTEDPKSLFSFRDFDAAGRLVKEVRNYDSGVSSGNPSGTADNQTVRFEFTDGLQTKLILDMPSGQTDQETVYTYGTAKGASAGDSKIAWDPLESTCRHASLSIL